MSTNKHIDKICIAALCMTLVLTVMFMFFGSSVISAVTVSMRYEHSIFDDSYVHSIDIVMDDWDSFINNCESEEYSMCSVLIDGTQYKNIAIRAKGNTSLSNVKSMNSQRYSFKLEFDHYESGKSCDGLDKLCLNNLIQDNTMMKDYIVYRMMDDFGADSPLCSFAYITVNGEDWGLYLAVEGIEDSFLSRNYGSDGGELYKPDSMSFGGGRGNGKDFNMDDMDDFPGNPDGRADNGRGSDDVKLKYIDDDPDSYSNIFENAKTDISAEDKTRLVAALKKLSEYVDPEEYLDMEEVLRYFVVHNFVCNGDSYTGSMIHNYYLHEKGGRLGMIPWDYNLAFGAFGGGSSGDVVNDSIDSPVSGGDVDDRPMVGWIFSNEDYVEKYHELFSEFISRWFSDGALTSFVEATAEMIHPYVEMDPSKFCTSEEFDAAAEALCSFVELRAEAVSLQLAGDNTPVDSSSLNISAMGSMGNGREGGGMDRGNPGMDFEGGGMDRGNPGMDFEGGGMDRGNPGMDFEGGGMDRGNRIMNFEDGNIPGKANRMRF